MANSGNLGRKDPVGDDVLSFHEQEIYPTASPHENCIEFEFRTDRNYYVYLRQTYLALKLKIVNVRGYETYNTKQEKEQRQNLKQMRKRWRRRSRSKSSRFSSKFYFALIFFQRRSVHQQLANLQL